MKLLFAVLLCFILLLSSTFIIQPATAAPASSAAAAANYDHYCRKKCEARCAKAGVKDRCLKYCNICCRECKCVPSGTYGNKHQCPCYRDKTNSKGKSKCP